MTVFQNALLVAGALLLVAALVPLSRLITQLPAGGTRRSWVVLGGLLVFFIAGYAGYTASNWNRPGLTVSLIFFLGACFVLVVATLSLKTVRDLLRLAALEQETIIDPLMNIYNRRHLDRRLKEEVARSRRHHRPLSLLLLDIDHFKQINDTHGHPVGDLVLKKLGQLIVQLVRDVDVVARYGGEELAVLAPDSRSDSASILAERLRKAVSDATLIPTPPGGGQPIRVTVSIGVASLGLDIVDGESLVKSADRALYRAKGEGRDRVVTSQPEATQVSPTPPSRT